MIIIVLFLRAAGPVRVQRHLFLSLFKQLQSIYLYWPHEAGSPFVVVVVVVKASLGLSRAGRVNDLLAQSPGYFPRSRSLRGCCGDDGLPTNLKITQGHLLLVFSSCRRFPLVARFYRRLLRLGAILQLRLHRVNSTLFPLLFVGNRCGLPVSPCPAGLYLRRRHRRDVHALQLQLRLPCALQVELIGQLVAEEDFVHEAGPTLGGDAFLVKALWSVPW